MEVESRHADTCLEKKGNFVLMVPRVAMLIFKLMRDPRVPRRNKRAMLFGVFYLVFPYDLIPEAIFPRIGYVDDFLVMLRALRKLIVDVEPAVIHELWAGSPEELYLLQDLLTKGDDFIRSLWERLLGQDQACESR